MAGKRNLIITIKIQKQARWSGTITAMRINRTGREIGETAHSILRDKLSSFSRRPQYDEFFQFIVYEGIERWSLVAHGSGVERLREDFEFR